MIMRKIPESDWKKLRVIREKALKRFCERVLSEINVKINSEDIKDSHAVYLDVFKYIQDKDKLLATMFDGWRRSRAFEHLAGWVTHDLILEEELETLSEETQAVVAFFMGR